MSNRRKHFIRVAIGVGLSVALLVWSFSQVDFSTTVTELKGAALWALIPTTCAILIHYIFRAIRWRLLLADGDKTNFSVLLQSILIGSFASYVLPLRAGEFVRPLFLARYGATPFAAGFLSVVVERFFDLAAVLVTFFLIVSKIEGLPPWVQNGVMALSGMAVAILCVLLVAVTLPTLLLRVFDFCAKILPVKLADALRKILLQLIEGAAVLRKPSRFIGVIITTALVWLTTYLYTYSSLYFLPAVPPSLELATVTTVIIALAVAAPSAPGFLGVYQTACLAAFALYKIPPETALAFSLISHAYSYVFHCGAGALILMMTGAKFSELRAKAEEVEERTEEGAEPSA